jgi:hypothetical protein
MGVKLDLYSNNLPKYFLTIIYFAFTNFSNANETFGCSIADFERANIIKNRQFQSLKKQVRCMKIDMPQKKYACYNVEKGISEKNLDKLNTLINEYSDIVDLCNNDKLKQNLMEMYEISAKYCEAWDIGQKIVDINGFKKHRSRVANAGLQCIFNTEPDRRSSLVKNSIIPYLTDLTEVIDSSPVNRVEFGVLISVWSQSYFVLVNDRLKKDLVAKKIVETDELWNEWQKLLVQARSQISYSKVLQPKRDNIAIVNQLTNIETELGR